MGVPSARRSFLYHWPAERVAQRVRAHVSFLTCWLIAILGGIIAMEAEARKRSRTEAEMEAHLRALDPSSERYHILAAARDFKAAWVALGDHLTRVRESMAYTGWGHATFEAYCLRELKIRRDTAEKLTRSYTFLRDHEPAVLHEHNRQGYHEREMPPLDVVDLLSRARERGKVPDEEFASIREEVFAGEGYPSRNQVLQRLRAVDPEAVGPARGAAGVRAGQNEEGGAGSPRSQEPIDFKKAFMLAQRLQSVLNAGEGISDRSRQMVGDVLNELRSHCEEHHVAMMSA